MFGNFIYFIIALLIFATYQPAESPNFSLFETTALFLSLIVCLIFITRYLFIQIEKRLDLESPVQLDHRFSQTQLRLSILSLLIFALNIYTLNLPDFIQRVPFLGHAPTFQAAVCMILFTGYLSIVWWLSHDVYHRIFRSVPSRAAYVFSNISFAVPVLIPWLVLSTLIDLLYALPSDFIKRLLSSTSGELFCVLVLLSTVVIVGPALIQKFWRCKPLPDGPIRSRIEAVCKKAGVSCRDIVEWPVFGGRMMTAAVLGIVKNFRYILVTRALLAHLTPEELDAVVAHEAGHVKKKHLLFYLFFLTGYMLITVSFFDVILYLVLYSKPFYFLISTFNFDPMGAFPLFQSIFMVFSFLIYFRYVFGYFMRNFERQADAYAFSMFDTAAPLVTTFQKIAYASGQSPDKPSWHHFSLRQRIDFLNRCELDRSLVSNHNRKVRRSVAVFLFSLLLIGMLGYQLNYGNAGRRIGNHLLQNMLALEEKNLLNDIEESPQSTDLIALLGDLYYSRKDFQNAIDTYEKALSIVFDIPHVLNNLAWLYATCEDDRYRNPKRALLLASRAAELDPSPETFDTLGESCYINGLHEEALAAGIEALERTNGNRAYYEEQLKKFQSAVNE